jgi:hypothetical protein
MIPLVVKEDVPLPVERTWSISGLTKQDLTDIQDALNAKERDFSKLCMEDSRSRFALLHNRLYVFTRHIINSK